MSDRSLRDDLRDYYLAKEPSPATLERLLAMEAATKQRRSRVRPLWRFILAAAALVVLASSLWIVLGQWHTGSIARSIADEVALNHRKNLTADFEISSYGLLTQAMDKLDFSLVEPARAGEERLRLVGARYCSIRGQLAAQLRLETLAGEPVTLYQTAMTRDLERLGSAQLQSKGLNIDLWHEGGVFMGWARSP